MRRAVSWIAALAMLVAAWFVAGETPDGEQRMLDPFPVEARMGVPVDADNLAVTIQDVRLTDRLTAGGWYAEGTWLVVSLDAALTEQEPAALKNVYLRVGERSFLLSERVRTFDADATIDGWGLHVGSAQSGNLVFELPADIAEDDGAATAVLQVALGSALPAQSPEQNHQGAAVIELPIDLTSLERAPEIELTATAWTTP